MLKSSTAVTLKTKTKAEKEKEEKASWYHADRHYHCGAYSYNAVSWTWTRRWKRRRLRGRQGRKCFLNESSVTTTTTAVPKEFYDIKVSGSTYIIDERVVDLKSLVSTVKLMSDNVIVRITDDNATKNAMDDLKKALTDDGREFTETVLDNSALDNSMADTTSEAVR